MAAADDAAPAPADDSAHVAVAPEEETSVEVSAAQDDDAQIGGEPLFIERPAPTRDPATELRSAPATAPASTPAAPAPVPAPVAPAASSGPATVVPAPAATAASATATIIPARPTEVRGVQIERGATVTAAPEPVALARTGVGTTELLVLAGALLALGILLIRAVRPNPSIV